MISIKSFLKTHYKALTSTMLITILITAYLLFNNSKDLPKPKPTKQIKDTTNSSTDIINLQTDYKQLTDQIKNSTQSLIDYNNDYIIKNSYLTLEKNIFKKDIQKKLILIDSKNVEHSSGHSTSNYTIFLDGSNKSNKTGGFGAYHNVIGFRLIKALIPNSSYQVTDNNNTIIIRMSSADHSINLTNGSYSTNTLAEHFAQKLNENFGFPEAGDGDTEKFIISYSSLTQKYTITNGKSIAFLFKWADSDNSSYRLFGFPKQNQTSLATSQTSDHAIDLSSHFVDLVIPEIPYISCKHNGSGNNIIDRIPLSLSAGSLVTYYAHSSDIFTQNFFYPITLSQITIQLYEDTDNKLYETQNADNAFEFELTILNNPKILD